ncbi:MAG: thioredoxin [Defluviitaleaceae bacterium]|nr:thioredoxin [Defluviitaleaceae bacterium]
MKPLTITKTNFEEEVMKSEKPVLIDFWASWCAPCRAISPVIDEIASEVSHTKICKINVDEEPELAMGFGATSIPLLVVVSGGEVVKQARGAIPKEAILDLMKV